MPESKASFLPSGCTPSGAGLLSLGFVPDGKGMKGRFDVLEGEMSLDVYVSEIGRIETRLTDLDSGEEYVLHLVPDATGHYVARVRKEVDAILDAILEKGFLPRPFVMPQTLSLIEYARDTYGTAVEFPWGEGNGSGVLRRAVPRAWYAVLMTVHASKLGLKEDRKIEIVNLRMPAEEEGKRLDGRCFFPAYHMTKRTWYSLRLDGLCDTEQILACLDESYRLAEGKPKKKK